MCREVVSCCLILLLVNSVGPAVAGEMTTQQVKDKVRQFEAKRSDCKTRLKDGTSLQGKIGQANEETFTITGKDGPRTVSYTAVARIQKKGLHPAALAGIIGGVVIGVLMGAMLATCGTGGC